MGRTASTEPQCLYKGELLFCVLDTETRHHKLNKFYIGVAIRLLQIVPTVVNGKPEIKIAGQ